MSQGWPVNFWRPWSIVANGPPNYLHDSLHLPVEYGPFTVNRFELGSLHNICADPGSLSVNGDVTTVIFTFCTGTLKLQTAANPTDIVKSERKLARFLVTGVLSMLLVPISWALTLFTTFGYAALLVVRSKQQFSSSMLGNLNEGIEISATVDFIVWFAALWGVQKLWACFRRENQVQGATSYWPNPRNTSIWAGVALCALPFSYYLLLGLARVMLGGISWSQFSFIVDASVILTLCAAAIWVSLALAVRLSQRSASRN
jgi:hypothetical protein